MDIPEFYRLVAEMRSAHREYARAPSTTALDRVRSLERRVDEALRRAMDDSQARLFED
jgi:ribosomal protein S4